MTLTSALSAANSGLATASRQAEITSGNIANASTPGYVRRSLRVGEMVLNGRGQGVRTLGVNRATNEGLTREMRKAMASAAGTDIIARSYSDLNRALGKPGDGYGLFVAYQTLESSLRELSVTPESPALQTAGVNALSNLSLQFNDQYSIGHNQRLTADTAIARSVRTVNTDLHRLADLNGQISGLGQGSNDISALKDERGRILNEISDILPIKVIRQQHGVINITTVQGVFLLSGSVHEIKFTAAGAVPPGTKLGDGSNILSGLSVDGQTITPNTNGAFPVTSGKLFGLFSVRDVVAPKFLDGLDAMAADIISRFSDNTLDPTKPAGAPGVLTDNGAALNLSNLTGLASRIRINSAIDPTQGGQATRLRDGLGAPSPGPVSDASILNNLLTAFTSSGSAPVNSGLSGNLSSSEIAAGFSSVIGEGRVNADAVAVTSLARARSLENAVLSETGVNTDAEMQTLLLVEQSYAANARVIQSVSKMLDTLMQL